MPIAPELWSAIHLLQDLEVGDQVVLTEAGREPLQMTVTVPARRSDGETGSIESTRVTVSLGPGRYATEVKAELVAAGRQQLRRGVLDAAGR